jgi:hypothetical protein
MEGQWDYANAEQVYYENGYVVVITPDDTKTHHHFHDSELETLEMTIGKITWKWNKSTSG